MKKLICILFFFLPVVAFPQWTTVPSGTTYDLFSVCFTDANTGYVMGGRGTILKTNNGGTTWTALSSGTINGLYSVSFPDANIGYAVGEAGVILKTINAGTNWST